MKSTTNPTVCPQCGVAMTIIHHDGWQEAQCPTAGCINSAAEAAGDAE